MLTRIETTKIDNFIEVASNVGYMITNSTELSEDKKIITLTKHLFNDFCNIEITVFYSGLVIFSVDLKSESILEKQEIITLQKAWKLLQNDIELMGLRV